VSCDDFRAAMAEAGAVDLEQFGRWYSQAGTPQVRAGSRVVYTTRLPGFTPGLHCHGPRAVRALALPRRLAPFLLRHLIYT
jgi:aminopeptidase N